MSEHWNAAKTHCKRGHEFTPENTYHRDNGARRCNTCKMEKQKAARRAQGVQERATDRAIKVKRSDLRRLVDIVWNEATESTAVPSTSWADRLIDKALSVPNGEH